jgi:hypothetical protein
MAGQASRCRTDNSGDSDFSPVEAVSTCAGKAASARARRASQAAHASGRRRLVDPTTCERDYAAAEVEFMMAMNEYKRSSGRMFPPGARSWRCSRGWGTRRPATPRPRRNEPRSRTMDVPRPRGAEHVPAEVKGPGGEHSPGPPTFEDGDVFTHAPLKPRSPEPGSSRPARSCQACGAPRPWPRRISASYAPGGSYATVSPTLDHGLDRGRRPIALGWDANRAG